MSAIVVPSIADSWSRCLAWQRFGFGRSLRELKVHFVLLSLRRIVAVPSA
jgi:hypothetical protein